jgi:GT2 family glycosyltransferase
MNMLVGISAFRLPDIVRTSLDTIVTSPADVVVVDNAADKDVKEVIGSYGSRITTIVNDRNMYCNGAWNQIMEFGLQRDYDIIALGTGTMLHAGWYEQIQARAKEFPKEIWLPNEGKPPCVPGYKEAIYTDADVAGYFSFMPREAVQLVYPIPRTLKHWFGDKYMFDKLIANGWRIAVLRDVRANHQWGVVRVSNQDAYPTIEEDKLAWEALK